MNKTKSPPKMDGTTPEPNQAWLQQQAWRDKYPWDNEPAARARLALADLGLYPSRDLVTDEGLATYEANLRAALPQIIDELDRTDLSAVYDLARLLAIVPRNPLVFTYIEERNQTVLITLGLPVTT